ncbi:MAG: methyltransferase domain-containing protein [Geobacteraceae bacterium]|nr:methyltransferase domain-containing protein [Geobacteraceae bacterium]
MQHKGYLMESADEATRLDMKTDVKALNRQALWAGIRPGMRVADIGSGSGITTSYLHALVQPGGAVTGVDASGERIAYARDRYGVGGIEFHRKDLLQPLDELGKFDFVWVRFVLEYFRSNSDSLVRNISSIVKPGGILCLVDLDHNCLNHYGMSTRLEKTLFGIIGALQEKANFDPYAGRKLYSYLYDLGYEDINVEVSAHHLIYGSLQESDSFNWMKKVEVAPKKIGYDFTEYEGGYEEFREEFRCFFNDPRRFTYSPIISCRGRKPVK